LIVRFLLLLPITIQAQVNGTGSDLSVDDFVEMQRLIGPWEAESPAVP